MARSVPDQSSLEAFFMRLKDAALLTLAMAALREHDATCTECETKRRCGVGHILLLRCSNERERHRVRRPA